MAGFIISVNKKANLKDLISKGTYASMVPHELGSPRGKIIAYSTLADYFSMEEGDDVYFLKERKIYGVGKIKQLNKDCCFENYPNSSNLNQESKEVITIDNSDSEDARWICFFEPNPYFFKNGVDMDDVLLYKPNSFRMLRAFQDRTFIKIDDEEDRALKEFLYLRNRNNNDYFDFDYENEQITNFKYNNHKINVGSLIKNNINEENNSLNLEMVLEAVLVNYIRKNGIFGKKWDYVTHQVIASPFKPLSYIDKMDIFAYKFLEYPHEIKPIEKYLVLELKKGKATIETVKQTMRYVDWICKEYASGDYSLIKAGIVAFDYGNLDSLDNEISRTFILSTHPIKTEIWNDLTCLKYSISGDELFQIEEYKYINQAKYLKDELDRLCIDYKTKNFIKNGKKMKPVLYNEDFKFAFVYDNQQDTIDTLSESGWLIQELNIKDTEDILQSKINGMINVKR